MVTRSILLLAAVFGVVSLTGCATKCGCRCGGTPKPKETEVTVEVQETETTTQTTIVDPGD